MFSSWKKSGRRALTLALAALLLAPQGGMLGPQAARASAEPEAKALAASASTATGAVYGFEGGTTAGWSVFNCGSGAGALSVSNEQAASGQASLKLANRGSQTCSPSLELNSLLQEGHAYKISLKTRLAQGSDQAHVTMRTTGQSNNYTWIVGNKPVSDADWTTLSVDSYTRPPGSTLMTLYVETAASSADLYVDEVEIVDLTAGPQEPSEPGEAAIEFGFDDGTSMGWGPRGSETVAVSSEAARTGTYSIKATGRTESWNGPNRDLLGQLQPSVPYAVTAYVKLAAAPSQPSTVRLSMENKAPGSDAKYTTLASASVSGTDWVQLKGTFSYSGELETLKLYVETSSVGDAFYVDDVSIAPPAPSSIEKDLPSLKEAYAPYFRIGAAVTNTQLVGVHKELLDLHYNSLVAENAMKPAYLSQGFDQFDWSGADVLANYVRAEKQAGRDMNLRFHTLLWHSQGSDWMLQDESGQFLAPTPENKELVLDRLRNYIAAAVERYKDVATDWDVVNEVIDEGRPDGMRDSQWYRITGLDFIRTAFETAREHAPDAKLYINDYGTQNAKKRDFLYDLVVKLRAEGVPIDGVGHQTHINIAGPSVAEITESIRKFGAAGFDNQLTELDVSVYTNNTDSYQTVPQALLDKQGYRYKELFDALKKVDDEGERNGVAGGYISNVTFWGIADDHTWLHDRPSGTGRQDAPFAFDKNYKAKPAFWGMVDPSRLPVVGKSAVSRQGALGSGGGGDQAWQKVPALKTEEIGTLQASFKTLWDGGRLHVLADVRDASVGAGDQVELFLKDGDRTLIRTVARGAEGAAEKTGGYAVLASFELPDPLQIGAKLKFDLRVTDTGVNDGSEQGSNGAIVSWSDPRSAQERDDLGYGELTLAAASKEAKARYGTPVIDGEADGIWQQADELLTQVAVEGPADKGATAAFRTLWDEDNLYVYAVVKDPLLSDASANAWEQDSIEIFVDQNNGKTPVYEADDGQYRINFKNVRTTGGHASQDNYASAVRIVDGGYAVEAKIALDAIQPAAGMYIGFDLQVNNDETGSGVRYSVKNWADGSGQSYQDTSGLGMLQLSEAVQPGEPGESESPQPTSTPTPTSTPGGQQPPAASTPSPSPTPGPVVTSGTAGATVELTEAYLRRLLEAAAVGEAGSRQIAVDLAALSKADAFEVRLPAGWLAGQAALTLQLDAGFAAVSLPGQLLQGAGLAPDRVVTLRLAKASASGLPWSVSSSGLPALQWSLEADGKELAPSSATGASATLAVPKDGPAIASAHAASIRFRSGTGALVPVIRSAYDAAAAEIRFPLSASGLYAMTVVPASFSDLSSAAWAKEAIETLAARGLIQGTGAGAYSPSAPIRRADYVSLLLRLLELKGGAAAGTQAPFADVPANASYAAELSAAKELGIAGGQGGGTFRPQAPLSRQEMMALTVRALQAAGWPLDSGSGGGLAGFKDAGQVADYARADAEKLVAAGLVRGDEAGRLNPAGALTRAEAAAVLHAVWKLLLP
ncbi:endo-1,4-beta-xylanase [Paenibacillus sp. B01]|uniref:endo-1,4-beta-xylanase n=1 Tax=Paenibacillus sp. B01 TaxID=2660554 RepID=UPI001890C9B0|nr:endo-1,4-beta-xylanase [Paenibacillus sp. B01]